MADGGEDVDMDSEEGSDIGADDDSTDAEQEEEEDKQNPWLKTTGMCEQNIHLLLNAVVYRYTTYM